MMGSFISVQSGQEEFVIDFLSRCSISIFFCFLPFVFSLLLRQGIFSTYVALWTSSHLLVYSSRLANAPSYNATSVVLLTETVKLFLASAMYVAAWPCKKS